MKISKRLQTIASFLQDGSYFADIGTDHAYLPTYTCLKDPKAMAIAGEKNKKPYLRAKKTVEFYQLNRKIDVRLGDGLKVIGKDPVKEVIIAGMGGSLIYEILESGKEYLRSVEKLIIQPNIGEERVRRWFLHNDYVLIKEDIIQENNHFYEILVAIKNAYGTFTQPYQEDLIERQLFLGPFLSEERSDYFHKKWQMRYDKKKEIIQQLKQSKEPRNLNRFNKQLKWIEEVLQIE